MRNGARKQPSTSTSSRSETTGDAPRRRGPAAPSPEPGPGVAARLVKFRDTVVIEATDRPWRSLALALGAGYVVGGGLFSRLTSRLLGLGLRIGIRAAVVPMVTESLVAFGEPLSGGDRLTDAESVAEKPGDGPKDSSNVRLENRKQLRHTDPKETHSS
jgi:hypothetical protein